MPRIEVDLTIQFASPPSVGAGGTHGTLADKVVVRDARGRFVLPASQLKGKVRHACEQLLRGNGVTALCRAPRADTMCPHFDKIPANADGERRCLLCEIFGSPAYPCRLRFHDLVAQGEELPSETLRPMVSLNRRRRVAQEQRLFLVETAPAVPKLQFSTPQGIHAIEGYASEPAHLHLLLASLKLLFAWGGGKSRGLGWQSGEIAWSATYDAQPIDEAELDWEGVKMLCQS